MTKALKIFKASGEGGSRGRQQREAAEGGSRGRQQREAAEGGSRGRQQREAAEGGMQTRILMLETEEIHMHTQTHKYQRVGEGIFCTLRVFK
jgi:hypothetical protein